MYMTARQLEAHLRANPLAHASQSGQHAPVFLPWGTRLTPAAVDLVNARKLKIRFVDQSTLNATSPSGFTPKTDPTHTYRWWCCTKAGTGAIRAALIMAGRQADLLPMTILDDASNISSAIRTLNHAVDQHHWAGGILVVEHAARATIECNRHVSLRAAVINSLTGLDIALREAAINVMIIELASQPITTLSNLLSRFTSNTRGDVPTWAQPDRPTNTSHNCNCPKGGH
jgi:hypothetical protein